MVWSGPMPISLPPGPNPDRNVYTVSRLNREVRLLLEHGLPLVWVEGELSNFAQPSSGHWYFSLKDRDAQIRCAMFRQRNSTLRFTPKAGQHVIVRGRVSLYEPRGDYQMLVEHMEEAGVGALMREFERLKAKLAAEGLFAPETKRALPRIPRRIGIVTSPTGAAVRDILHILARRFPPAAVLIYPTAVQGAAAIPTIVEAIELASARAECDVLIVARGGGSIEDLWAFNDERVARAIRASKIPVVSGIGHEIDFTIADFVADARAPTPSGAAELVVPDRQAWLLALKRREEGLGSCMRRGLRDATTRLDSLRLRLKLAHPGARLSQQAQRLDDLEQRLTHALRASLQDDRRRLSDAIARLLRCSPAHRVHEQSKRLGEVFARLIRHSPDRLVRDYQVRHGALQSRLQHAARESLARAGHRLDMAQRTLNTVSPLATLARGFSIVTRVSDGALVTDNSSLSVGDEIEARLAQGRLRAKVTDKP